MKRFSFSKLMLVVGLLFIYLPMLILVIYSFNASKLVTVWGGWSVRTDPCDPLQGAHAVRWPGHRTAGNA